ncbi:MAG TPA: hypothetical protein VK203_21870 [Nostocaceae cyanobacterium]|nr:hypothetical protein [Nostocaceae cyanobacterium]
MSNDILELLQPELLKLRNEIAQVLAGEIGTYTFHDGSTAQAIALLGLGTEVNREYPPPGTTVTNGLEVVIYTANQIDIKPSLDGFTQNIVSGILLKQYNPGKDTVRPMLKLMGAIDIAGNPIRTMPDSYLGNIETMQLNFIHSFYTTNEEYEV